MTANLIGREVGQARAEMVGSCRSPSEGKKKEEEKEDPISGAVLQQPSLMFL